MVKKLAPSRTVAITRAKDRWLDLEEIAIVEVSSEDAAFQIESALRSDKGPGWRAAQLGEQQIRLIFDQPISLRRIYVRFEELEHERTQEFTLAWRSSKDGPVREIVRQQWNFSPNGSAIEIEDYAVNLDGVSVLELAIRPDVSRVAVVASLAEWRIA